ncbi:MAG: S9 family peptidase [Rhodospirillales bacterium]|nr:MAG: S9 family peptidase [Rhodospirillales bacterium]
MSLKRIAPYGAWASPITADLITGGSIGFTDIVLDGTDIYWGEQRPAEEGRTAIVKRAPDGVIVDVIPRDCSARSRVHEYGGGAFTARAGTVWFCNDADQRVWVVEAGGTPRPLTPEGLLRFADFAVDPARQRLICVCEDHACDGEPENRLAAIAWDGGAAPLHRGRDFYASPRVSPDARQLAWIAWDHPNMPWDGTELWLADIADDGSLVTARRIAGGADESIFQPEWSPDGVLHFVSDRTGWWNLYRWDANAAAPAAVHQAEAEFGQGHWQFGMSTYGFAGDGTIVAARVDEGVWRLGRLRAGTGDFEAFDLPFADYYCVRVGAGGAAFQATGDASPAALVLLDTATGRHEVLRHSADFAIDPGYVSAAEPVAFASADGETAHGFLYMPANPDFGGPHGELPPLIVKIHGGPTSQARPGLALKIQFWTSRGFAVLDVNYRGSTGFGTAYRRKLDGAWGVADVDDCVAGARRLAEQGRVDGARLIITGGSAGGYTTLAALAFHEVFRAGASHYGIGDLMALADDTHKFESRYLDRLVGPLPATEAVWRARSPINHVEGLNCPVIFFQGLEDKVVPPNQAEAMVAALRAKGIPVAYVPFEGEGHGFRRAENIKRALEGELYFYARVFGFAPADAIAAVEIDNL